MSHQPLFPHVGICALVPDAWDVPWQPRHYVLRNLARYFHITWVNPAPEWRGLFWGSKDESLNSTSSNYPPGLQIYQSWLPRLYHPDWLSRYSFNARLRHARGILVGRGCRKIILYIWRPEFAPALDSVPFDLSCYHIDDEYSFSAVEADIDPGERALIAKVDQVFIHSPGLMERKGTINSNTTFVPNGVDFRAYATPVPEPEDLSVIPRPRFGYTGYIKKQLDWPLILKLVRRHRDWSFVFVGPRSPHPEILPVIQELSSLRNVYFLGCKSPLDLPGYSQHFDACIMPYRVDAYTNNIYPMKLHECLAGGRPVVSSPIRSVRDFSGTIALAEGIDEWSCALTGALEPVAVCSEAVAARQKIAREHDWRSLACSLARVICERFGPEYAEQFDKLNMPDDHPSRTK
jgi:hypothetical protein